MNHRARLKLITLQSLIASLNDKTIFTNGKDPFVALPKTDTTITIHHSLELWHLDGEFESAAMAITMVGLEFWGFLSHGWSGLMLLIEEVEWRRKF